MATDASAGAEGKQTARHAGSLQRERAQRLPRSPSKRTSVDLFCERFRNSRGVIGRDFRKCGAMASVKRRLENASRPSGVRFQER